MKAIIYSKIEPNKKQYEGFIEFLKKEDKDVTLEWVKEDLDGFKLVIGSKVYDWTREGKIEQLKEKLNSLSYKGECISLLKETVNNFTPSIDYKEEGYVVTSWDGIATVKGLNSATYGEILIFSSGVKGMVQEISNDKIGVILFDEGNSVLEGDKCYRTKKTAGVPVGDGFLGRVVNALGAPIDDLGEIKSNDFYPIEGRAPGIIEREPVKTPLETGILSIDAMFPIGRGQRELIIGDRQTGKTTIATDAIINQKGKDVICIYVAIGQKTSSVVQIRNLLEKNDALSYSIIVSASASEPSPLQYIAPYSGCALGEYFMRKGKDVLIIYDDLSKHAVAYRALSLLLDRSPGREAYPGDVFYLHSRLLERSAKLSKEYGGGSLTALPIIETQAGDVSSYIPTNVISITDGQIFLESELFFSGQRPAVNVGLSVSRVGGDAQTKAMKKAASTLRIDLAQFREMEVFTQFSSDLDDQTRKQLDYGRGLMRMLRQKKSTPYEGYEIILILVSALSHNLEGLTVDRIDEFNHALITYFKETHFDIVEKLKTGFMDDELKDEIIKIVKEYRDTYINA